MANASSVLIVPVINGYKVRMRQRYDRSLDESDYVFHDFFDLVGFLAEQIAPTVDRNRIKILLAKE